MNKPLILYFSKREEMFFVKRLSIVLRSGIPLLKAMQMLASEQSSTSLKYVYQSLIEHVSRGQGLSSGMRALAGVFGDFTVNMVQVGESSGSLHENLSYVAEDIKKKGSLKKKVLSALAYPSVIVFATLGISIGLVVYLFPKIIPIFKSLGHELPASTRFLLFVSDIFIEYGFILFILFVISIFAIIYILRFQSVRIYTDALLLRIPIFGTLSSSYNLSNISRTLAILLHGRMQIIPALYITANCATNTSYRSVLLNIADEVVRGQSISKVLIKEPRLFPAIFSQMISVGESTGDLVGSLTYLSEVYEEDMTDLTRQMTALLEPILMIGMGIIVGFIAVSIITPIYGITQNLNTLQ